MTTEQRVIKGFHNILTGVDMTLVAHSRNGENLPYQLTMQWRKARDGGYLTHPRIFKGITDAGMERISDNGFKYYGDVLDRTARTGNVVTLDPAGRGANNEERFALGNYFEEGLPDWDKPLTLGEASAFTRRIAHDWNIVIRKIGYFPPFMCLFGTEGLPVACYGTINSRQFKNPSKIAKDMWRGLFFHPGQPIMTSSILHEMTHALIDQKLDDHKSIHGYYAQYHAPLFHILYSEMCALYVGANPAAMRDAMRRQDLLAGLTEPQVAIILDDVWTAMQANPRTRTRGWAEPGLVSGVTGYEYLWVVGGRGRHEAEKPKPVPQKYRNKPYAPR